MVSKINILTLRQFVKLTDNLIDVKPIIAFTMKMCGATSEEVGEVFQVSRQVADGYIKKAREVLK